MVSNYLIFIRINSNAVFIAYQIIMSGEISEGIITVIPLHGHILATA